MTIASYITKINKRFESGISSEHSYRADLEDLLRILVPDIEITNEPTKVTDCGNPDYVITKNEIPIGFIEAKDIGKDLNSSQYKEQFDRYRSALDNLIITDYIYFLFFQNGELVSDIRIGEINVDGTSIRPVSQNFDEFSERIIEFCEFISQTIKSPRKLAQMMAGKARLLETILDKAISSDEQTDENTALNQQYETFKSVLIHDLTPQEFADIYAQTLAYGMFAARLHDKTLDTFSRQEAAELIPNSNPFLRKLFNHVAGIDIDRRIKTTVDNLAEVFRATNVEALLNKFGSTTKKSDPVIHFYETFLANYDPYLRESRGVYYTPESVVSFIVRAVDHVLINHFQLPDGLSDTSKTLIEVEVEGTAITKGRSKGKRLTEQVEVHKVQVLDPAVGTGTFLAETIKQIYHKQFKSMQGIWTSYVQEHLIPRLYGFEILMASYSMAHLKLEMLLDETGYDSDSTQRLNIYLSNSLEEHHPDTGTLFSSWLSTEANNANRIKRDTPVMVVMGNPPYKGESINKGDWIMELLEDYKKEPGGEEKLQEKVGKWLNDDYVKFLRYGQFFIEKNGEGILAFVNSHSFLDNPTFRGMRWNLMSVFDRIYILDLHGNTKKKEVAPDGSPDVNVFDIEQGVSINIFVKTKKKKRSGKLAEVLHADLFGARKDKYEFLASHSLDDMDFEQLDPVTPYYFFVPKDFSNIDIYDQFFSIKDLFVKKGNGIVTKRDRLCIQDTKEKAQESALDILNLSKDEFYEKYRLPKDVRDWKYEWARDDIEKNFSVQDSCIEINYRPFDSKWLAYTGNARGFVGWPVSDITSQYVSRDNVGLLVSRMTKGKPFAHCFATKLPSEAIFLSSVTSTNAFNHPLYTYSDDEGDLLDDERRQPNLSPAIVSRIGELIELTFEPEKSERDGFFSPIDVFDYVYAVLHASAYRTKYDEFLKIEFPRIPYPKSKEIFWILVDLGGALRKTHLLEPDAAEEPGCDYPVSGNNVISRGIVKKDWEIIDPNTGKGRIWINDDQYFDGISTDVWELYIGGYQPAQKWLKDRKGKELSYSEIVHYQKMTSALSKTIRLVQEIDDIDFLL